MFRWLRDFWAKGVGQKVAVVSVAGVIVLCSCAGIAGVVGSFLPPSATPAAQSATNTVGVLPTNSVGTPPIQVKSTDTPTPRALATPTTLASHYPPTTQADLQWLGSQGDASAIQVSPTEMTGAVGACPEPRGEVIIDPSITGQRLAEDLLAFFYSQGYNTPCGSLILAYHSQNEVDTSDFYTAGRINLDTVDSSGQPNFDPNATGITYTLTLDVSGDLSGQGEYIITYTA